MHFKLKIDFSQFLIYSYSAEKFLLKMSARHMLRADCGIIEDAERISFAVKIQAHTYTYIYIELLCGKCMRALARYVPANENDEALH